MEFGLWVEPEMVNEDSDVIRAHPDWICGPGNRTPVEWRHQQVIDLYQTDLCILRLPGLRLRCGVYHPTIPPILRYSAHAYFPEGRPADAPIHIEALSGLVIGVTLLVGRVVSVTPTVERQTPVVPTAP